MLIKKYTTEVHEEAIGNIDMVLAKLKSKKDYDLLYKLNRVITDDFDEDEERYTMAEVLQEAENKYGETGYGTLYLKIEDDGHAKTANVYLNTKYNDMVYHIETLSYELNEASNKICARTVDYIMERLHEYIKRVDDATAQSDEYCTPMYTAGL